VSYYIDMDEKMVNLYCAILTIHQQERLIQFASLSYNELVTTAIDQERVMKAVAEVDEKKRKKMMPGSAGSGSSSGAPPHQQLSMLQLLEDGPLCSRMPPAKAKQLAMSSGTRDQLVEGPSERSYTTDWPH
jgi:hypothetical protein